MKVTRRLILQFIAGAGVGAGFGPLGQAAGSPHGSLPPALRQTLASYFDTLIPDEEQTPGAVKSGIDKRFASAAELSVQARKLIVDACLWLDAEAQKMGARAFSELDEYARNAIVDLASRADQKSAGRQFFERTRYVTFLLYYGSAPGWSAIGYSGPPQPRGFPDYADPPARPR